MLCGAWGWVRPKQIFESAAQALNAGDYPAAETGFNQVLKLDPRNYLDGLSYLEKAQHLTPDSWATYFYI
jgi:hypothetical protein